MIGASRLAEALKADQPDRPIGFVGSHTSALPREVLALPSVDIVFLNEGVYALHNLLRTNLRDDLHKVAGTAQKRDRAGTPFLMLNPPQAVVPQERMDEDLPGYAWDCCRTASARWTCTVPTSGMPASTTPGARRSPSTRRSAATSAATSA